MRGVSVSNLNNGYQMDKRVHRIVLPLFDDVGLNHKLVSWFDLLK